LKPHRADSFYAMIVQKNSNKKILVYYPTFLYILNSSRIKYATVFLIPR